MAPRRDERSWATWKRLGFTKHDGRWTTPAEPSLRRVKVGARCFTVALSVAVPFDRGIVTDRGPDSLLREPSSMSGLPLRLETLGSVDEILHDLDSGLDPSEVVRARGLEPADLIAAVVSVGLDGDGPPLVRVTCPHRVLVDRLDRRAFGALFPETARPKLLTLAAGVYQVLDAWEASHEAAQEADDLGERVAAAYWHGIAHRREPDAGNAAYWFRRVGRHAIFPELVDEARRVGLNRLVRGDAWDPFAFIDYCTTARPGTPDEGLARRLQKAEMDLLLDATVASCLA